MKAVNTIKKIAKKNRVIKTANVFMSGNSKAIRLPKSLGITASQLKISREGKKIILEEISEKPQNLYDALMALPTWSDDFFPNGRGEDGPPQERDFTGLFE
jgi:virulence-associated protein VagC